MFRCFLSSSACLALASLSGGAFAQDSAAHSFCRMSWASQPAAMDQCVNAQIAGAQSVVRWLDWAKRSNDPAAVFILTTFEDCRLRWSPDYERIDACLKTGSPLSPPSK